MERPKYSRIGHYETASSFNHDKVPRVFVQFVIDNLIINYDTVNE